MHEISVRAVKISVKNWYSYKGNNNQQPTLEFCHKNKTNEVVYSIYERSVNVIIIRDSSLLPSHKTLSIYVSSSRRETGNTEQQQIL